MDADLTNLERKIENAVAFCQSLREQNSELRNRIAGLETEKLALTEKIETTRERLEALMTRLPEQ